MKLLVLAVLVSVMRPTPSVSRHTLDGISSSSQRVQKHPTRERPSSSSSHVEPSPNSNPEPIGADVPSPLNSQQSIAISKLPAVSVNDVNVKKDWMDKTAWLFGGLLVVIGVLGVCAAVRTLRAIEAQAAHMQGQHETMKGQLEEMKTASGQAAKQMTLAEQNIKIITSKERARLRLEPQQLNLPDRFTASPPAVGYTIRLYGPTEAIIKATTADANYRFRGPAKG